MAYMDKEFNRWLSSPNVDGDTKNELYNIKGNNDEITSRFAAPLSFGTAGLRGIMRGGINGMNVYTVSQATEGLARLIIDAGGKDKGVAIAYDSRNNSRLFAERAAEVLAYNNIKVYLFDSLRPTPELSFAVLHHGCIAGINITASHNPKEYNGYKVYWSDGAQLPPEHASQVSAEMAKIDLLDVKRANLDDAIKAGIVTIIGSETDSEYIKNVLACSINPDVIKEYGNSLNLVYTPLHGTGYKLVPEVLRLSGIDNLVVVPEQSVPDGNFPTVVSPNPESRECFELSYDYIKKNNLPTNVIIATDPDGDRLGVAVKVDDGSFIPLSGNQIGAILVDYIIKARKAKGLLPQNACAIRSVVSSTLFDKICVKNGVTPVSVLTGFKYIGEKIKEYAQTGEHTFIFGYEESQGFLSGGYVRDKDAVAASLLIAEAASYYKSKGKTLYDALCDIYAEYGYHDEITLSVTITGALPLEIMNEKMKAIRQRGISEINSVSVALRGDFADGTMTDLIKGVTNNTNLPLSDMLYFGMTDGTTVIIRPSGTEPKVKAYILTNGKDSFETAKKLGEYKAAILKLFE